MMNQPYDHVAKLRESCKRMNKCRQAAIEAAKRNKYAGEEMDAVAPVTVTSAPDLAANLQR
jgi:hypothetical protein